MGADETFGRDTDDREVILRELLRPSPPRSPAGCGSAGVAGRTVTITVRFADFTTITRSRTMPEATDVTQEIYRAAVRLYDALGLQRARLRLVGVRVEGLVPRDDRAAAAASWASASTAGPTPTGPSTAPPCRFGSAAVRPASLIDRRTVARG